MYENAPIKVWQWMLNADSHTKWFLQFVHYAEDRAREEGRDIQPPPKPPRLGGGRYTGD